MLWMVLLLALAWLVWMVCRDRRRPPARSCEDASTSTDGGSCDDERSASTAAQTAAVGATLLACSADATLDSDSGSDSSCSDTGGDSSGSGDGSD